MRTYFQSIDWGAWWEEFYLSVEEQHRPRWATVRAFVHAKTKNRQQQDFLVWYLGPEEENVKLAYYQNIAPKPVDWIKRRNTGGWFNDASLRAMNADISRRMNALDALRETGNRFGLHFLSRASKLAEKLDETFKGVFFIPGLSAKENRERAETYLSLHERVLQYYAHAQDLYAKAHGVNFQDMAGLVKLMEAATIGASITAGLEGKESPQQAAVKSAVELMLAKAGRYPQVRQLIPPEIEGTIVDAVEEQESKASKKKQMN
jgi:hypothetical protein